MKKIMILTLMLVMMFSLTACGNKENQNNNTNNNEQKTVTDLGFKDAKAIQNFVDNFKNALFLFMYNRYLILSY